jgi:hypothetical protein
MWMKARIVLVIETISVAAQGSNIRATGGFVAFSSNYNALASLCHRGQKSVLPPRSANDATRTRRLVLFCAVPS